MRFLSCGIALVAAFLASHATAQCPLPFTAQGVGAVHMDRAIVGLGPVANFYARTDGGWEHRQSATIGDLQLIYDSPVAIQGTRALAGSPESDGQKGRAWVFDLVGTEWIQTELVSPTVQFGDFFGWLVALDGDVAVVGADHWAVGGGDELDRAHVFEFDGTSWAEVAQLTVQADSLDVEGSRIVLGDDDDGPYGSVFLYEKIAGSWIWTERIHMVPPTGGPALGASVALQGDTLVVGAARYSGPPGYVRVFDLSGGGWVPRHLVVPNDSETANSFGASVALSGGTLLVGAPQWQDDLGKVYRFEHDGTAFVETDSFLSEEGASSFGFGRVVAVDGQDALLANYPTVAFYRLGFEEASSFCSTTANSTGAAASLAVSGCDSVAGQSLRFVASALPAGTSGYLLFGPGSTATRFGDGVRCIGNRALRLPAVAADSSGSWVQDVDFEAGPGSRLTPGRTWYFQAVYRDPAGAGTGVNLTNALAIGLTP